MTFARAKRIVDDFNRRVPVGTLVQYGTGSRNGQGAMGVTTTDARLLGSTPIVFVEGARGCIALTHIDPVEARLRDLQKRLRAARFLRDLAARTRSEIDEMFDGDARSRLCEVWSSILGAAEDLETPRGGPS
jgi:hypothetical protein